MNSNEMTITNPTGLTPPDNDIKNLQKRRRGIAVVGDEKCQISVVKFPLRSIDPAKGAGGLRPSQEKVCDSGSVNAALDRFPMELDNASARTGRTERANPVGVLMPSLSLTRPISGRRPNDVGVLTHAIVQILAPHSPDIKPSLIPERVLEVAADLVNIPNVSDRRSLITTASGNACVYLRGLRPTGWDLLGCEFNLDGGGRVDLAYRDPKDGRVMFDEIKTSKSPFAGPSPEHDAQCVGYRNAGNEMFGDQFMGVRLLYLSSLNASTWFSPCGGVGRILPTRVAPLAVCHNRDLA